MASTPATEPESTPAPKPPRSSPVLEALQRAPHLNTADPELRRSILERALLERPAFAAEPDMRYGGRAMRGDEPRPVRRLLVRCVPSEQCPLLLQLPNGNVLEHGKPQIVEIYTSDLGTLQAHVADDEEAERVSRAREHFEDAIAAEMVAPSSRDGAYMARINQSLYEGKLRKADVRRMLAEGHPDAIAARKLADADTTHSFAASFHTLFERSPAPLASIEVLTELEPPKSPTEEARLQGTAEQIPALAAAVGVAVREALAPVLQQLRPGK